MSRQDLVIFAVGTFATAQPGVLGALASVYMPSSITTAALTWTAAYTDNGDGTWTSAVPTDNNDGTWTA